MRAAAMGGVLALLAIGLVLALGPAGDATAADRADALAAQLRCPDCQGLSVADSQTAAAREIRRQVKELVAAGASDDEVRAHFTDRYGQWILLAPSAPLAWIVPFAAVLVGLAALAVLLISRRAGSGSEVPAPSDEQRRRIRDEAEAIDA